MSVIIGIDLGTSTTEAAVFRNDEVEMILNMDGDSITPSAVGIDEGGNWVFGARARAQLLTRPEHTAIEVKRKTGSGESIQLGKISYQPVELQARLLSHVRGYVSEYLGEDVTRAVVSVPAYFNQIQRMETVEAGRMAGFEVERILNEPTAAAMSYGLDHLEEESHVLVYDLGGGTFDVTLLEMFDGVLEVKASSGNNQLGGKDFDEKLIQELLRRFSQKHKVDLNNNRGAMVRLKEEAEKCKMALSAEKSYRVLLPALCTAGGKPVEMDEVVTRDQFEKLTAGLLRKTHAPIDTVLSDAGLKAEDLDQIILVGGSTRMPMVAKDVKQYLGKDPSAAVHPDYAVASGAAILAGIMSGEIDPAKSLVMTDVNPYTLGIRTADSVFDTDVMSPVIPRNSTIPVSRTERYSTMVDGQREAQIDVYQGESMVASHNHFLGSFTVQGIPPKPAGKEKLDVEFSYDLNGLLKVTATLVSNGKQAAIEIDMKESREEKAVDPEEWKNAASAPKYRALIRTAERLMKNAKAPETKEALRDALNRLKLAIVMEKPGEAEEAEEDLNGLVTELRSGE